MRRVARREHRRQERSHGHYRWHDVTRRSTARRLLTPSLAKGATTRFTALLARHSLRRRGDDVLIGGGGKDTLTGGAGADTFKYLRFADSSGRERSISSQDFEASAIGAGSVSGDFLDLTALGTAIIGPRTMPSFTGLQAVFSYNAATD